MNREVYKYTFHEYVPVGDIENTLALAVLAAESLHGGASVRLDGRYLLDAVGHACVIDATTQVGKDLNRIFVGYVAKEFGDATFQVERIRDISRTQPLATAC